MLYEQSIVHHICFSCGELTYETHLFPDVESDFFKTISAAFVKFFNHVVLV